MLTRRRFAGWTGGQKRINALVSPHILRHPGSAYSFPEETVARATQISHLLERVATFVFGVERTSDGLPCVDGAAQVRYVGNEARKGLSNGDDDTRGHPFMQAKKKLFQNLAAELQPACALFLLAERDDKKCAAAPWVLVGLDVVCQKIVSSSRSRRVKLAPYLLAATKHWL